MVLLIVSALSPFIGASVALFRIRDRCHEGAGGRNWPLTLNQRVQGSSPCAPTNQIKVLADLQG